MAENRIRPRTRRVGRTASRPGAKPSGGSRSPSSKSYGPGAGMQPVGDRDNWDDLLDDSSSHATEGLDDGIDPMGDITPDFADLANDSEDAAEDPEKSELNDDKSEVENAENSASPDDGLKSATDDKENALQDDGEDGEGGFYKKSFGKRKVTAAKNIQKVRIYIAIIAIVGPLFGVVALAPGFLVGYLGDMVINNPTSRLAARTFGNYRTSKYFKFTDRFTWDGRRSGRIMAEMERGKVINGEFIKYEFSTDPTDPKKFTSFTEIRADGSRVVIQNTADEVDKIFGSWIDRTRPIASGAVFDRTFLFRNDVMESIHRRMGTSRKSVLRAGTAAENADPERATNARIYESLEGKGEGSRITADGKLPDDTTEADKVAAGAVDDALESDGSITASAQSELRKGTPYRLMNETDRAIVSASNGTSPFLLQTIEKFTSGRGVIGKVGGIMKGMFDITDLPESICIINQNMELAIHAARYYSDVKLALYGYMWLSADDGVRSGVATSRFLRELMHRVTLKDDNGKSFASAPSFGFAQKGTFNKAENDGAIGSTVRTDGDVKGPQKAVKDNTDIPGCPIWKNPIAKITINAAIAVASFFTFGAGGAAARAEAAAAGKVAETSIRSAIVASIKAAFSKAALKGLPKGFLAGAVGGITIAGVGVLSKIWAERQLHMSVTGQETGGTAGQIFGGSAESINEQATLARGYTPSTPTEYAAARSEFVIAERKEMQSRSVFDRYFNVYATGSLANSTAATVAMGVGSDFQSTYQSTTSAIARLPLGLPQLFGKILTPAVGAQGTGEAAFDVYTTKGDSPKRLAITPTGSLLPVLKFTDKFPNPLENREVLQREGHIDSTNFEPLSDSFKNHMANCVEGFDILSPIEEDPNPSKPDKDCLAQLDLTQRFKVHLTWLSTHKMVGNALFPEDYDTNTAQSGVSGTGSSPSTDPVAVEDLNCEALLVLDARYKFTSKGTIELGADGMPVKTVLRPYNARVKDACQQRKAECISGNMPYSQKALCEGFQFSETFYGASFGKYTALTQEWYGIKAKRNPEHNADGWDANWRPGLNEDNLFGCTGLITISVYKAYDPTIDSSEFLGSPKFTRLKSMDELQPGDFMGNNSLGHWVIVAAPPANGKVIVYHASGYPKVAGFAEIPILDNNSDGDNIDDGWDKGRWMRWKGTSP